MIVLKPSVRFEKAVKRLGPDLRKRAAKSLKQFIENPRHPHLHFEKLSTGYRTIRVDRNFRIVLREIDKLTYDLIDVGDHTRIYQEFG